MYIMHSPFSDELCVVVYYLYAVDCYLINLVRIMRIH
jgi:hypothetical protein